MKLPLTTVLSSSAVTTERPDASEPPGARKLEGQEASSSEDELPLPIETSSSADGGSVTRKDENEPTKLGSRAPIASSERRTIASL